MLPASPAGAQVEPDGKRRAASRSGFGRAALGCVGCAVVTVFGGGALLLFGYFVLWPRNAAAVAVPIAPATPAAEQVIGGKWSVPFQGKCEGVSCRDLDGDGVDEVALGLGKSALLLNHDGTLRRKLSRAGIGNRLAIAYSGGGPYLIGNGTWSDSVRAYSLTGKPLWSHKQSDAVDWAAPIDLQDPEGEAIAIGYNGDTGLHVLDVHGKVRTRIASGLGNVWCVVPLRVGKGKPDLIACTNAAGTGSIFDGTGKLQVEVGSGVFFGGLVAGDLDGDGADELVALGTDFQDGPLEALQAMFRPPSGGLVAAFNARGVLLWKYQSPLPAGDVGFSAGQATIGRFLPGGQQVAVVERDGSVTFLDGKGQVVARQRLGQKLAAAGCLHGYGPNQDALVLLTGTSCECYAAPAFPTGGTTAAPRR